MSWGEKSCKLYGKCSTAKEESCNTDCELYNPKDKTEAKEVEAKAEKQAPEKSKINLQLSNLPKFDKQNEFVVLKKHVFQLQSISPKKVILKFRRKLTKTDKIQDGCYVFRDENNELLDPYKIFLGFDRARRKEEKLKKEKNNELVETAV